MEKPNTPWAVYSSLKRSQPRTASVQRRLSMVRKPLSKDEKY